MDKQKNTRPLTLYLAKVSRFFSVGIQNESNSVVETPEQCVKYVQSWNSKCSNCQ